MTSGNGTLFCFILALGTHLAEANLRFTASGPGRLGAGEQLPLPPHFPSLTSSRTRLLRMEAEGFSTSNRAACQLLPAFYT